MCVVTVPIWHAVSENHGSTAIEPNQNYEPPAFVQDCEWNENLERTPMIHGKHINYCTKNNIQE